MLPLFIESMTGFFYILVHIHRFLQQLLLPARENDNKSFNFIFRRQMFFGPVISNGAYRLRCSYRNHYQTLHKCSSIGIMRNAIVQVYIFYSNSFPVQNSPSADACTQRKTFSFPQRTDRVFICIITFVFITQNKCSTICSGKLPRSTSNKFS